MDIVTRDPINWVLVALLILGFSALYKIIRARRFILTFIRSLPKDLKFIPFLLKLKMDLRYFESKNLTVFHSFDNVVKRDPKKTLIYFQDFTMNAEEIQIMSYKMANYFQSLGLKKGDCVGIFMENCAEYLPIWLGLSRIGVVAALINCQLRLKPLKHCVEAVACKALIFNHSLASALQELFESEGELKGHPDLYYFQESCSPQEKDLKDIKDLNFPAKNLKTILKSISPLPPNVPEALGFRDRVMYIFTSGTTGLPKAASIKHSRVFLMAGTCHHLTGMNGGDVLYTALPLYHGSGTPMGSGITLVYGSAQVIRKKFSASKFWPDCIKYKATVSHYIGETCRYMVAQPKSPLESQHSVRAMFGNGLRADIWKEFISRFNVRVAEVYGSTEGNCGMANFDDGRVGAVGCVPLWAPNLLPVRLIKVDEQSGEPLRDGASGFVTLCGVKEPGELIGRIVRSDPLKDFEGYADQSSTKEKILLNAFSNGDTWFRTGDILVKDELGYFYFKDRKGDTFRWKGENCSTCEVEQIIISITGLKGTVVFGVNVPNCEGKAGMAVISDVENTLDLEKLSEEVLKSLPPYARPLFLRVLETELETTGTYKLKKMEYQRIGFDVNLISDKIYFFNGKHYKPLDSNLYKDILAGNIRL